VNADFLKLIVGLLATEDGRKWGAKMLVLKIRGKTWPWLLLLDTVRHVRDNAGTSVVKPLVLDLHRCHEFGCCSLNEKRIWVNWRQDISQTKAFRRELCCAYVYVVVSKVRPEWRMEVDVHLLPTNLLQAMDHLLCFKKPVSTIHPRRKGATSANIHGDQIPTYPPSFGGIPQCFLCLAFVVQLP
jgi:hypothetical protein